MLLYNLEFRNKKQWNSFFSHRFSCFTCTCAIYASILSCVSARYRQISKTFHRVFHTYEISQTYWEFLRQHKVSKIASYDEIWHSYWELSHKIIQHNNWNSTLMLHNFEYSWEERLKKATFFAVVRTVSSPPPLSPLHVKKYKASSCHTEMRKTKRQQFCLC